MTSFIENVLKLQFYTDKVITVRFINETNNFLYKRLTVKKKLTEWGIPLSSGNESLMLKDNNYHDDK